MPDLGKLVIEIEIDGTTESHEIDLDPANFRMSEAVAFEEAMGSQAAAMLAGEEITVSFAMMQALVWVKLRTIHPGLKRDGFDFELGDLATTAEPDTVAEAAPVPSAEALEAELFAGGPSADRTVADPKVPA